nr:hypothetical protein [Deinococcus budaensis]
MARYLARQAQALGLDLRTLDCAGPEALRAFAEASLQELSARGLLSGEEAVGCWSAPRFSGH